MLPIGIQGHDGVDVVLEGTPESFPERGTFALVRELPDDRGTRGFGPLDPSLVGEEA